jgi:hypothetical protein
MNKLFSRICEYYCVDDGWKSLFYLSRALLFFRHSIKLTSQFNQEILVKLKNDKVKCFVLCKRTGRVCWQEFGRDPQNPSRKGMVVGPAPEPYILFLKKKDAMMFRLKYHE